MMWLAGAFLILASVEFHSPAHTFSRLNDSYVSSFQLPRLSLWLSYLSNLSDAFPLNQSCRALDPFQNFVYVCDLASAEFVRSVVYVTG